MSTAVQDGFGYRCTGLGLIWLYNRHVEVRTIHTVNATVFKTLKTAHGGVSKLFPDTINVH